MCLSEPEIHFAKYERCVSGGERNLQKKNGVTFENSLNITVHLSLKIHTDTKTCTLSHSSQFKTDGIDAAIAGLTVDR